MNPTSYRGSKCNKTHTSDELPVAFGNAWNLIIVVNCGLGCIHLDYHGNTYVYDSNNQPNLSDSSIFVVTCHM